MALDWQMTGSDAGGGAINILHHILHTAAHIPYNTYSNYSSVFYFHYPFSISV